MDIKHLSTEKVKALLDAIEETRPIVTSGQPAGLWHTKRIINFNPPPPKLKDVDQQKIWACHWGLSNYHKVLTRPKNVNWNDMFF